MDILMLILSCSLIQDDALVRSIICVQSENYIYYVGDKTGMIPPEYLETYSDTERALTNIHRHSSNAFIDFMGIHEDIALEYGLKPINLFHLCINIKTKTSILSLIAVTSQNLKDIRKNIPIQFLKTLGPEHNLFVYFILDALASFDKSNDILDSALLQSKIDSQTVNLCENDNIFKEKTRFAINFQVGLHT